MNNLYVDLVHGPWPWYLSGVLIGLTVPLLLILTNRQMGISASFRHLCAACLPSRKPDFLQYDWKSEGGWLLIYAAGIVIGAAIASALGGGHYTPDISESTISALDQMGISHGTGFMPEEIFSFSGITHWGWLFMIVGGFLIGFGTRYANGCTSGHAIMGLALLNPGSLVAVIGFFIGGLAMTHLLFPILFAS